MPTSLGARPPTCPHAVWVFLPPQGVWGGAGMGQLGEQGARAPWLGAGTSCCAGSRSLCSFFCAQKS